MGNQHSLYMHPPHKFLFNRAPQDSLKKMVGPSNLKSPSLLQLFNNLSLSSSSSSSPSCSSCSSCSSSSTSMKIKTLIQTLLLRLLRLISAAKSKAVAALLLHSRHTLQLIYINNNKKKQKRKKNKTNKIFFGSFRLHYNWCASKSSHVLPVPASVYDATWNVVIPTAGDVINNIDQYGHESQLYGYLQWLEEQKVHHKNGGAAAADHDHDHDFDGDSTVEVDDIDKLADRFIATCHAKFILEKQESARRFKEMLERSA